MWHNDIKLTKCKGDGGASFNKTLVLWGKIIGKYIDNISGW